MKNLLSLTLFVLLAGRAFAVDGVVLINQSIALAGGVTPGDTPGFPVTISVSGSYQLSGNLVVPDGNTGAILITADNVTINLNGFSIIGPVVCSGGPPVTGCSSGSGVGIISGNSNISVSNGTVRGMFTGIDLLGAGNRIANVQAISNFGDGIDVGPGVIVSSSTASYNGRAGIFIPFSGLSNIAKIVDNVLIGNGSSGMAAGGLISGNLVTMNTGAFLRVAQASLQRTWSSEIRSRTLTLLGRRVVSSSITTHRSARNRGQRLDQRRDRAGRD